MMKDEKKRRSHIMELIHKAGMPLGWVRSGGKTFPVFVCSKTGLPISPSNRGTLYWDPDTGDMIVISDEAETANLYSSDWYSTELDVLSYMLFQNTAGPDGSNDQKITRENAAALEEM